MDTEALRCIFPGSAYFQGAPVPHRATHVMGDVGRSRLPLKEATLSEELPSICALNLVETTFREGFTTASPLPEAAFITSMSLMKQRLYFLGSMNPLIVTRLLSGK